MNLLQATGKIWISWRVEQLYSSNLLFYARHPFFFDFLNWHSPVARIIAGGLLVLTLSKVPYFMDLTEAHHILLKVSFCFFWSLCFFCPYLHFAHEDARSQKSKDPSMFFQVVIHLTP